MKKRLLILFSIGILALILNGVAGGMGEKPKPSKPLLPAPNFTLPNLEGAMVNLSDFKGKVVIVDFWATWCPPCKAEIPSFIDLYSRYKAKGYEMIGISLDRGGAADVRPFARQYKMNYTLLLGNDKVVADYGGIAGIPTTFVLNRKHQIWRKYVGYRDRSVFEADLKALL